MNMHADENSDGVIVPEKRPNKEGDGRPPGQRGPRQLESPTAASHHLPSEYRPAIPAEENSSLTTAGSRACRGCSEDQPRTLQSTVRLPQPFPGSPSHV